MSNRETIKKNVLEIIESENQRMMTGLDRIIGKATDEQLNAPGAAADIFTALAEESARQFRTNPRTYPLRTHRRSRKAVKEFWWMTK